MPARAFHPCGRMLTVAQGVASEAWALAASLQQRHSRERGAHRHARGGCSWLWLAATRNLARYFVVGSCGPGMPHPPSHKRLVRRVWRRRCVGRLGRLGGGASNWTPQAQDRPPDAQSHLPRRPSAQALGRLPGATTTTMAAGEDDEASRWLQLLSTLAAMLQTR